MLIQLFFMFAKLSLFSFGGGYVMIPIMLQELEKNKWATASDVTDIVALAGMSPGPVAVNAAVGLGYKVAGLGGVISAFLGIAVPCAIVVILVAMFFFKIYNHQMVKGALYGLRPVITGIIIYAAIKIAIKNGIMAAHGEIIQSGININIGTTHLFEVKSMIIALIAFFILTKTKIHPIFVILVSGIAGIFLF